jgi:hypothetical protein
MVVDGIRCLDDLPSVGLVPLIWLELVSLYLQFGKYILKKTKKQYINNKG